MSNPKGLIKAHHVETNVETNERLPDKQNANEFDRRSNYNKHTQPPIPILTNTHSLSHTL